MTGSSATDTTEPVDPADDFDHDPGTSPSHIGDPRLRFEFARALIWCLVIGLVALAVYLSHSLLVIFGAMVFGCLIDAGARGLERILPVGRGIRVAIVLLLSVGFLIWLVSSLGTQIAIQAAEFPAIIQEQVSRLTEELRQRGFSFPIPDVATIASGMASSVGTVTRAIGGIVGGLTTMFLIVVIGIYFAIDPRIYERGVAWMVPGEHRAAFYDTLTYQAKTMRRLLGGRLLGMVVEGVFTWVMLAAYGVPMATLLGIITGLLAFIPNIGALLSGILMVLVGFSGGTEMGIYTIFVYLFVQNFDGYVIVPMIAKKTVDLAPALVLSAQLIFGVLFGILGLALADPLLAMMKVALERRAARLKARMDMQQQERAAAADGA